MSNNPIRPVIRVQDKNHEYVVFLNDDGTISEIIKFRFNSRIGTVTELTEMPWSARWQVEQELLDIT